MRTFPCCAEQERRPLRSTKNQPFMKKIAIKYGLLMFLSFAGLFLIMHEVVQLKNYNLRVLNAFAHLGFIYAAIRTYRQENPESLNNYVSGVAMGMYASLIGVLPFVAFIVFYLIGDTDFMTHIQETMPIGQYLTPFTASLFVMIEGVAVSLIGSYLVTRVIDMRMVDAEPEYGSEYHD